MTAPNAYSLFNATTPGNATVANDGASIELGMRFSVDRVGTATELKYWRSSQDAADTDVRQGHLWRADGTLLATVTFTSAPGESGWQTATLSNPVGLVPGVAYVVSYRTANNYVATNDFFSDAHDVSFDGLEQRLLLGSVRCDPGGAGRGRRRQWPLPVWVRGRGDADPDLQCLELLGRSDLRPDGKRRQPAAELSPRRQASPGRRTTRRSASSRQPIPTAMRWRMRSPAGPTPPGSRSTRPPACSRS